jgi:hypothetical protein
MNLFFYLVTLIIFTLWNHRRDNLHPLFVKGSRSNSIQPVNAPEY